MEEQIILEELIDAAKPPARASRRMHYLLSTPFRYPPLRHGSRFGTRYQPGIWYGSETVRTAFAEVAYYRLLFLDGSGATLNPVITEHTAFTARARTEHGIDLTAPPFARHAKTVASRSDYRATQSLGESMRVSGVEMVRYPSARDVAGGVNVAVLSASAFGSSKPRDFQTWHCVAHRGRVEVVKRDYFGAERFTFDRSQFLVGGALPAPAT